MRLFRQIAFDQLHDAGCANPHLAGMRNILPIFEQYIEYRLALVARKDPVVISDGRHGADLWNYQITEDYESYRKWHHFWWIYIRKIGPLLFPWQCNRQVQCRFPHVSHRKRAGWHCDHRRTTCMSYLALRLCYKRMVVQRSALSIYVLLVILKSPGPRPAQSAGESLADLLESERSSAFNEPWPTNR